MSDLTHNTSLDRAWRAWAACRVWATSMRQILSNASHCSRAASQKETCASALSKETYCAFPDEHRSFFGCFVHVVVLEHREYQSSAFWVHFANRKNQIAPTWASRRPWQLNLWLRFYSRVRVHFEGFFLYQGFLPNKTPTYKRETVLTLGDEFYWLALVFFCRAFIPQKKSKTVCRFKCGVLFGRKPWYRKKPSQCTHTRE